VRGTAIGGVVQELALPSGRLLFEWRSLDHVTVDETHAVFDGHPLDYFHVNSIDLTHDGNLLVSARNTWAVYKVSRTTGEVLWRLGGKKSSFEMGKGTVFAWQHDARHHGNGLISIFDDGAAPQVEPQSRALLIALDGKRGRARLVRKYTHRPGRLVTKFMGNAQVLGNGNVVVGWGNEPYVTEFAPDGTILFDGKLPPGGQNYRAFRFPWVGLPVTRPALVAHRRRGVRTLYASWNGATEVASWQLYAAASAARLEPLQRVAARGFETALVAPAEARYANAVALDSHGRRLGKSKTIRT
jgi:arylsulfotransferase ASST